MVLLLVFDARSLPCLTGLADCDDKQGHASTLTRTSTIKQYRLIPDRDSSTMSSLSIQALTCYFGYGSEVRSGNDQIALQPLCETSMEVLAGCFSPNKAQTQALRNEPHISLIACALCRKYVFPMFRTSCGFCTAYSSTL
jgi:hypothetical protein